MLSSLLLATLGTLPGPTWSLDLERPAPDFKLFHGAKVVATPAGKLLEFTTALQFAEVPFQQKLDGAESVTIGGWFLPRRYGEQSFLFRGVPEIGPLGERFFRRQERWVNALLGTDQHGFLMGTINGNGSMPFPLVTLHEVPIDAWSQLVVVKDAKGFQKFYANGALVHTDRDSMWSGKVWPMVEREEGEPLRLSLPLGGQVAAAWIYPRELSAEEVRADYQAGRDRFRPAPPGEPVTLRAMDTRPAAGLWERRGGDLTKETWPKHRDRIRAGVAQLLGPMPETIVPLEAKTDSETDCGNYVRRKVSIQVQPGDRMPAWLLVPKDRKGKAAAVIAFYGTTSGAGKDTTVGLSGGKPGTPPERNRAFAIDFVEAGFVVLAPDYLRDGERIAPGKRPYDTTDFYERFPDWSIHGKDAWDTMRAVDYLQSLPEVDPERIGMVGHSYGGHSTIFTAALEPRLKAVWANGPVSDFLLHGMHWAAPKGAGGSASLPAMRPFVLDRTRPVPATFYEWTSLIAPRPLAVCQAVGERRPMEEENAAAVGQVYAVLGVPERVRYVWSAGDHDFPAVVRTAAVAWLRRWLN
jgi:dienelactone hydrolase